MLEFEKSGKKIMNCFFDFSDAHEDYISSLDQSVDDDFQRMITKVMQNMLQLEGPWVHLRDALFLEKRIDHFHHGQCVIDDRLAIFFYFDDTEKGCVSIASFPDAKVQHPTVHAMFEGQNA